MRLRKIAPLLGLLSLAAASLIAGECEGKDDHSMTVKTNFWVSASKTALMETLSPSRMEEMIKLYSVAQERFLSEHPSPSP